MNFDLNRRASPRPYLRERGGETPPRHSPVREGQRQALLSLAAVDHEGEVLEAVVTARRDKAAALKLLKRIMKKYGAPPQHRHRRASGIFAGDERDRCCC